MGALPALSFVPALPEGFRFLPGAGILRPDGTPARVLLHCCCAPCSSAILEWMVSAEICPCVFFSNANIVPETEYLRRRNVLSEYAASLGLTVTSDRYDPAEWLAFLVAEAGPPEALARMRERGPRCLACFRFRLGRSAAYAAEGGFDLLTTTLAASRWKDLSQVDAAGRDACAGKPVRWWGQNWRKGGLQERRSCLIRETGMYNQSYCGCAFSIKKETGSV